MTEPIRVDLLDILTVVLSVVAALVVSSMLEGSGTFVGQLFQNDDWYTDGLICCTCLATLTMKRSLFPVRPGHPTGSFLARGFYLLTAILGALLLTGSVIEAYVASRSDGLGVFIQGPLVLVVGSVGLLLMGAAQLIDTVFLERKTNWSRRR